MNTNTRPRRHDCRSVGALLGAFALAVYALFAGNPAYLVGTVGSLLFLLASQVFVFGSPREWRTSSPRSGIPPLDAGFVAGLPLPGFLALTPLRRRGRPSPNQTWIGYEVTAESLR